MRGREPGGRAGGGSQGTEPGEGAGGGAGGGSQGPGEEPGEGAGGKSESERDHHMSRIGTAYSVALLLVRFLSRRRRGEPRVAWAGERAPARPNCCPPPRVRLSLLAVARLRDRVVARPPRGHAVERPTDHAVARLRGRPRGRAVANLAIMMQFSLEQRDELSLLHI